jgi:hypothetical protein
MKTTPTNIVVRDDLIKDIMRFGEIKTKCEAGEKAGTRKLFQIAKISRAKEIERQNCMER